MSAVKQLYQDALKAVQQQQYRSAVGLLDQLTQLDEGHGKAWLLKGVAWKQLRNFTEALRAFDRCLQQDPQASGILNHVADCYYHLGDWQATEKSLLKAIDSNPNPGDAMNKLAYLYQETQQYPQAYQTYEKLTHHDAYRVVAWLNMGMVAQQLNRPQAAIDHYRKVLVLNPSHGDAYYALGTVYMQINDFEKAMEALQKAINLQKDDLAARLELMVARACVCDWSLWEQDRVGLVEILNKMIQSQQGDLSRIVMDINYFDLPPDLHGKVARQRAAQLSRLAGNNRVAPVARHERLRIGYLSPDLRQHVVGRTIGEMFRHHDRSKFEIYAYSLVVPSDKDPVTELIRQGCDHFVDCDGQPAGEIAAKISRDQIDLLIDLGGYTTYTKPGVMALRPAPLQLHFIGNPDTMGADFIPYMLADRWLVPEGEEAFYSERILYLPNAWVGAFASEDLPAVSRTQYGVPDDTFVYSSFNHPKKLDPVTFRLWMDILRSTDNSVLWIYAPLDIQQKHLKAEAGRHGIDPDRLIFAGHTDYPEYLARMSLADLFLDNLIYTAGATAVNALMNGLPLLTCPGRNMVSRLGSSVCAAAGLEQWICGNPGEYLEKAVYWGRHPEKLRSFKNGLADQVKASSLGDLPSFTRSVEIVLLELWESLKATP